MLCLLARLAHLTWLQRRTDEAATLYAALDVLQPNDGPTLIGLAASRLAVGDFGGALEALARHARCCETTRAAQLLQSRALRAVGCVNDASLVARACMQGTNESMTGAL